MNAQQAKRIIDAVEKHSPKIDDELFRALEQLRIESEGKKWAL
jgi:hypothetical protein